MTMEKAISILGINRTLRGDLAPMVRALHMHSWLNTEDDNVRLEAAEFVIRRWKAYQTECNRRRSA